MQSIDHLMDSVAVYISERKKKQRKYFFSKIDLKYAYSQIPLDENIKKHCNFKILHRLNEENLAISHKSMQQPNESFETFYSRLREQGAHCKFEHLKEDLIKDIFISNMRSSNIQMELLLETRTPQQALNYAVNRERRLANHQEILRSNNTNCNTVSYVRTNRQRTYNQNTQQKPNPCWKCGGTFSLAHLQTCPAKTTTCKICKKAGHYTSLCTAKMPERRPQNTPQTSSAENYKPPQTRRIRNINQEKNRERTTRRERRRGSGSIHKRTSRRLGKHKHNTPNTVLSTEKQLHQQRIQRRILGRKNNPVTQTTVARRYWLATIIHKPRVSTTTPKGDPKHKNRKVHREHNLQMLQ